MTLLLAADLAEACPSPKHHPGEPDAVLPFSTTLVDGGVSARYRCPCGYEWQTPWTGGWPVLEPRDAA